MLVTDFLFVLCEPKQSCFLILCACDGEGALFENCEEYGTVWAEK